MKSPILLLALIAAVAFSSCTTAYKTGQTPDDVYYSPARPEEEYVRVERKEEPRYQSSTDYYDDRYLRMKVRNRNRWSDLDDWYYYGNRYTYSYYNNSWSNPWSPYTYWNCTYNPYYHGVVIVNPKSPTYSKPRVFNLNTFNAASLTNKNYTNPKTAGGTTNMGPRQTYSGGRVPSGSNTGNRLRDLFGTSNNNSSSSSNNSSSTPARTTTSSSSSSSSGSSSGGSAPVRRF